MLNRYVLPPLLVVFLLFAAVASAAESDRGIFWQAQRAGQTVYLLGSVHLATADFYPLRAEIERAYADSDALVVEADIIAAEGNMALQQQIMLQSLYQGDRSLRDDLSPTVYKQLQSWLQQRRLPEAIFIRQRPAIAMISISMVEMQAQGLDPRLGIDRHFLKKAKRDGKPIVELEGILQQLRLLNSLENPSLLLQQTLEQLEDMQAFVPKMTSAWKRGDSESLYRLIIAESLQEHPEYRPMYDTLFFQRNRTMAEKIASGVPTYQSLFVIVGAGHLVGDRSVIELLREQGYRLQQL